MADLVAHTALAGRSFEAGHFKMVAGCTDTADAGWVTIALSGDGTIDLLAIVGAAPGTGGKLTMRLAALRVDITWQRMPGEAARIAVERFNADYLWEWLVAKILIEAMP